MVRLPSPHTKTIIQPPISTGNTQSSVIWSFTIIVEEQSYLVIIQGLVEVKM